MLDTHGEKHEAVGVSRLTENAQSGNRGPDYAVPAAFGHSDRGINLRLIYLKVEMKEGASYRICSKVTATKINTAFVYILDFEASLPFQVISKKYSVYSTPSPLVIDLLCIMRYTV